MIWMHKTTKALTKNPKKTMKRSFKYYSEADRKLAANLTDWGSGADELPRRITTGQCEDEEMVQELEAKTIRLETNIRDCMEIVAPMKIIKLKKKRAAWITKEILEQRRYRERLRAKARRTGQEEDFKEWKDIRRKVAGLVKKGLKDQLSNSSSAWKDIKAHLGWDSQVGPEALIVKRSE